MRKVHVVWTPEMTAEVVVRTAACQSAEEIGLSLGLTDRHVLNKRKTLGIKPPRKDARRKSWLADEARRQAGVRKIVWDQAAKTRLADLVARNMSMEIIATEFGTTVSAVSSKASKLGLRRVDEMDTVVLERMLELAEARWRASRIARQLGVDETLVRVHVGHLVDDRPLGYGRPPVQARQLEAA